MKQKDKTRIQMNKIEDVLIRVEKLYNKLFYNVHTNFIGIYHGNTNCMELMKGRLNFISCYNQMELNTDNESTEGIVQASNLYVNCTIKFVNNKFSLDVITPKNITFRWNTKRPSGGGIVNCVIYNPKIKKLYYLKTVIIQNLIKNNPRDSSHIFQKTYYTTELITYK